MVLRGCALLCAAFAVLFCAPGVARAQFPPDRGDRHLTVAGDVHVPLDLTMSELRAYPGRTELVTFLTDAGPQTHAYEGVALEALITAAQPKAADAAEHPLLTLAVVAVGTDGYAATLSWADVAPVLARRPALLAWTQDGTPLDAPRLVVPEDVGGARYVRDLTRLRVVQLAPT